MREYTNKDIIVYWFPELCAHPGICLRTLPEVFCVDPRPWADVDAAEPAEITSCIDKWPSGALRYCVPEGSSVDPSLAHGPGALDDLANISASVKIKATYNGPYLVEGPVEIIGAEGRALYGGERVALCSCGHTKNCPFCDGSHNRRY